jgi:hypothetical protein
VSAGIRPRVAHRIFFGREVAQSGTQRYELEKREWISNHPEATPEEYERAIREIAERLNY